MNRIDKIATVVSTAFGLFTASYLMYRGYQINQKVLKLQRAIERRAIERRAIRRRVLLQAQLFAQVQAYIVNNVHAAEAA